MLLAVTFVASGKCPQRSSAMSSNRLLCASLIITRKRFSVRTDSEALYCAVAPKPAKWVVLPARIVPMATIVFLWTLRSSMLATLLLPCVDSQPRKFLARSVRLIS